MGNLNLTQIWKTANNAEISDIKYSISDIQKYRQQKSQKTSKSNRLDILFDIGFKFIITIELVFLLVFLNNQVSYKLIIGMLVLATFLLIMAELSFIKKLQLIRETDSVINNLKKKLNFLKTSYRKFILISALSSPLFVFSGFMLYYFFKYGEIQLESPIADPVMYGFLVVAFIISYFSQNPHYKVQLKELEESIEEMDDEKTASIIIQETKRRHKKNLIVFSILILLGFILLALLLIY